MPESSAGSPPVGPDQPGWIDPDDVEFEWTRETFDGAAIHENGVLIRPATGQITRPGRPPLDNPKQQVTLRLDADVLEAFRATGKGWQSRINQALRDAITPKAAF